MATSHVEELIAGIPRDPGRLAGLFEFLVDSEDHALAVLEHLHQPGPPAALPDRGTIEFGLVLYWIHEPSPAIEGWLNTHVWLRALWRALADLAPPTRLTLTDHQLLYTAVETTALPWADGTLIGTNRYEQLDPGWLWAVVDYIANLLDPSLIHPFVVPPPGTTALTAADPAAGPILAIVGDWGTGFYCEDDVVCPAERLATELRRLEFDYLVHLGDVYYAGTDDRPPSGEEQLHLVDVWPESRPGRSLTLNSNHEMYGGAQGLFSIALNAPAFSGQDGSSAWSRSTGPWLVLGLDSARYADALNGDHMYMDGAIGSATDTDQIDWVQQFRGHDGPIMVLTHHNPCGTFTAATNQLFDQVQAALARMPDLWYWGHVHNGIAYQQLHIGNSFVEVPTQGRCCGHGAIPFGNAWGFEGSDEIAYYAHTKDSAYPLDSARVLNGYATVQLHPDATFTERFYELGRGPVWPT